jgi:hypothetical protein
VGYDAARLTRPADYGLRWALRLNANLSNRVKLMLPVQSSRQKYFASRFAQITSISPAVLFPLEGRFAIVTDVGNGMRWTRVR